MLEVRVIRHDGRITVEVADNGQGIDSARLGRAAGMGLAGLKERVALAGGTLEITSEPGSGTRLFADLPVQG